MEGIEMKLKSIPLFLIIPALVLTVACGGNEPSSMAPPRFYT